MWKEVAEDTTGEMVGEAGSGRCHMADLGNGA